MNQPDILKSLLEQEYQHRANLREAEETYRKASLVIRVELGRILAAERDRAGLSRQRLSILLGCSIQKIFAAECPDKVNNPYSVPVMLDLIEQARKVADYCQNNPLPVAKRGRAAHRETLVEPKLIDPTQTID